MKSFLDAKILLETLVRIQERCVLFTEANYSRLISGQIVRYFRKEPEPLPSARYRSMSGTRMGQQPGTRIASETGTGVAGARATGSGAPGHRSTECRP